MPLRRVLLGGSGSGGEPAWRAAVSGGIALTNRLTARLSDLSAGISVSAQSFAHRIAQTPAFSVSTSVTGTAAPAVNPALSLAPRISSGVAASQIPAYSIEQIEFGLVHRKGGVTATSAGPGWANPTNAQGDNNGTSARCTGAALDPAIASLKLNYSDLPDKDTMTITQVRLIFYSQLSNSVVLNPPVRFEWSKDNGGAWTLLQQVTTDYDDIPAGRAFVLSPIPTWAELDALEARMTVDYPALSAATTLDIDAIELEITANETWSL